MAEFWPIVSELAEFLATSWQDFQIFQSWQDFSLKRFRLGRISLKRFRLGRIFGSNVSELAEFIRIYRKRFRVGRIFPNAIKRFRVGRISAKLFRFGRIGLSNFKHLAEFWQDFSRTVSIDALPPPQQHPSSLLFNYHVLPLIKYGRYSTICLFDITSTDSRVSGACF